MFCYASITTTFIYWSINYSYLYFVKYSPHTYCFKLEICMEPRFTCFMYSLIMPRSGFA